MSDTIQSTTPTRTHQAAPPFKASQQLADNLQQVSADLVDLHLALDEVVDAAREFSDTIAERMRAVYVTVDGRAARVATQSSIAEFPATEIDTADCVDLIVGALYAVAGTVRRVHDAVDAEDPTSADILHTILERLEQLAWMIDAENRTANASQPANINE